MTSEPWRDEQNRQEALEAHMAQFPSCEECGRNLMDEDTVIYIKGKWYCDRCADIMSNDDMRSYIGVD